MPSRYDTLTLADAEKLLEHGAKLTADDRESLDFYAGDLWRGGLGWIGQKPPAGEQYAPQMAAIAAGFVAQNVVREVAERHAAGVLGREPRWGFVPRRPLAQGEEPTADEAALMAEADAALTGWWDRRRPLPLLKDALTRALLIARSPLRLFVPDAALRQEDGTLPTAEGLAAALDYLYPDAPAPDAACVLTDPATEARVGVYRYQRQPADQPFAAALGAGASGERAATLTYADDMGQTVVREVTGQTTTPQQPSAPLPLGGRIAQHDLTRPALVTAQVRQLQKGLNLDLTQMLRNVNLAGSLERIFLNVEPPGRRVDSAGNPWVDGVSTGEPRFIEEPLPTGAAVSAFLGSRVEYDQSGKPVYANGTLNYRDPVPVTTFAESKQILYAGILQEVAQTHALISGDATASGESRKQARAEFAASLEPSKAAVDEAGRWLLETALALAAAFSGQPGRYEALRCEFGAVVDAGPLSAEDRRVTLEELEGGAVSLETALSDLGRDDVAAELARIDAEREAREARAREAQAALAASQPPPVVPAAPVPGAGA
jgi:hypothetical protein